MENFIEGMKLINKLHLTFGQHIVSSLNQIKEMNSEKEK